MIDTARSTCRMASRLRLGDSPVSRPFRGPGLPVCRGFPSGRQKKYGLMQHKPPSFSGGTGTQQRPLGTPPDLKLRRQQLSIPPPSVGARSECYLSKGIPQNPYILIVPK